MKERPFAMERYGISRERYYELKWRCRQYPKNKRMLNDLLSLHGARMDGHVRGSGTSDPVAVLVIKRDKLSEHCEQIENAAKRAGGDEDMAKAIIQNQCYRQPYWRIIPRPLCGENQFYRLCNKLLCILHEWDK